MRLYKFFFGLTLFLLLLMCNRTHLLAAEKKKVLVVMSYHPVMSWQQRIKEGIEQELPTADLKYFHLDTKRNNQNGAAKAREAFQLFQEFKPDGVIATDDNAQELFVVPYLKDKVVTPVIFCGVNDSADKYGYPSKNVTGVLEKKHIREGIHLLQLIDSKIKKLAIIYSDNTSNRMNLAQIKGEQNTYPVQITASVKVSSITEAKKAINDLETKVDAFYVMNLTGIKDASGNSMEGEEAQSQLTAICDIPSFGYSSWQVESGLLCGVVQTGIEQGSMAGKMLKEAWQGKPFNEIKVSQNRNGRRIINVTTAARLKLKLNPRALVGTELVH